MSWAFVAKTYGKNVFWPFFDCEISKFLLIFNYFEYDESNGDI